MVAFDHPVCHLVLAAQPLAVDAYATHRATGSFILIDPATGNTVGAGMISGTHGVEYSI